MITSLILFLFGLFILVGGANLLVSNALGIARRFNISPMVAGLLIVGVGTSIPELSITLVSNFTGNGEIGIGTIIGSNIFNLLIILSLAALIFPLKIKDHWIKRDMKWNVLAVVLVMALLFPFLGETATIGRLEGLLLLSLFAVWAVQVFRSPRSQENNAPSVRILALPLGILMIMAGIVGVVLGGKWVVGGALALAQLFSVSPSIIALFIVGIGTSLPELVVSLVAALKRETGIVVGNIVGSNIFDFFMILGAASLMKPLSFDSSLILDLAVGLLAASLILLFLFVGERYTITRVKALLALGLYFLYIFTTFLYRT
ncbi:MAG: calcium/sodium antiporter [Candidatus Harrisonbacteria bacterium]|nr:calcium/sodium antiporter [Candidatus Harrisonbacteria bacterium]